MRLRVEISPGEAIDKITILEIKRSRIADRNKLEHVRREAETLREVVEPLLHSKPTLRHLQTSLQAVNEALWTIEDRLRDLEARGEFGADFVRLARDVYMTNDKRAALKAEINALLGSDIAEQKSYAS
ncbi:DUF6165 family protein [Falsiroseomonas tokyonensis]|uniref:DUF6165 family protein n=1 Tax=Falsiroseomonas tokyonensis TaxID=430521 RepID=A0ABV7C699_9PROT|nr:DUF6165 family protein [Falsiroseomonas tokyonensis]MBU8541643.1 hypothetical protein [Falsiroseomonas tokyonensis]